jgi:DNA polymerase gamma 1
MLIYRTEINMFVFFQKGWTKYEADGTWEQVPYPDGQGLVLDVEICCKEGEHPTLATAVSTTHW